MSEPAPEAPEAPRLRRRRRGRLGLLQVVWVLLVASVAAIAALSFTGAPLQLPDTLTRRIETAVNARLPGAALDIGSVELRFGPDGRPEAQLGNVAIRDAAGNPIAQLNTIGADFSPTALAGGQLQPRVVQLSGAQLTLRRDAQGGISVSFGGLGGAGASTPGEAVALVDRFFFTGPMAGIETIEASDITITLEDARTGRVWQATGGQVEIANRPDRLAITIRTEVFNGTEDLAQVELTYDAERGRPAAKLAAHFVDATTADIAAQSPALAILGLLDARISGGMQIDIDDAGALSRLAASLDIGPGRLTQGPEARPFEFAGGRAEVEYDPDTARVAITEVSARTDLVTLVADGQLLLGDLSAGWPREVYAQIRATRLDVAPGTVLAGPLTFDRAFADVRVALDPFALDIGQLTVEGPRGLQHASGRIAPTPEGWRLALDIAGKDIAMADALALWPLPIARGVREWMADNVLTAQARDLTIALRAEPGERPVTGMSVSFEDADVRVMRDMPPVTGASGTANFTAPRFAMSLSEGQMVDETGGVADLAGSTFVVADSRQIPRRAEVAIRGSAQLAPVLRLLENPPFRVLSRATRPEELLAIQADADLDARVRFPIKRGLLPEEVAWDVTGTLTDVTSADIVPGRPLAADRVTVSVTPERLELTGPVTVGGLPLEATFRHTLVKDSEEPARVTGRLALSPETLPLLGVVLPDGSIAGAAEADVDLTLPKDGTVDFRLTSDLVGARLAVAPLGWSKPGDTPGALEVEGRVADGTATVSRMRLEAPGLTSTGRVDPGDGPGRAIVRLDRVQAGSWLDAPVTLTGQGPGQTVAVSIDGGSVNLARRPDSAGGSSGGAVPLRVALDRLTISEGLALAPFSGEMSAGVGLSGTFEARVNGGAPVSGALAPSAGSTAIQITADDGGAVLRDAGIYPNARGGDFSLLLSPQGADGNYAGQVTIDGVRVVGAPVLAGLLNAVSVVGLIDELQGAGILFDTMDARFDLSPDRVVIREGSAVGASLGISMDGLYDIATKQIDMQGVVSPIYLVNGIGQLFTRRGEGLFGFSYRMTGAQDEARVEVNPLSILTPGMFRDIFRRPLPVVSQDQ
jgi:hypothetical protein